DVAPSGASCSVIVPDRFVLTADALTKLDGLLPAAEALALHVLAGGSFTLLDLRGIAGTQGGALGFVWQSLGLTQQQFDDAAQIVMTNTGLYDIMFASDGS